MKVLGLPENSNAYYALYPTWFRWKKDVFVLKKQMY